MSVLPLRKSRQARSDFGLKQIWEDGSLLQGASAPVRLVQVTRQALLSMARAPLASVLTVLSTAVAFFLLTVLVLVAGQLGSVLENQSGGLVMNIFLKDSHSPVERDGVEAALRQLSGVQSVRYISPREALESFESRMPSGQGLLSGFEQENPLPASFEVVFRTGQQSSTILQSMKGELERRAGVELVQYSDEVLQKFGAVAQLIDRASACGVLLALVVVCFVVASTVQLALFAHRDELEVMRLVGATDSYIRAPYMIEGALQGMIGASLGLFGAFLLHTLMHSVLGQIELLSMLLPDPRFLPIYQSIFLALCGGLLGAAGSWVATRSFMKKL